MFYGLCQPFLLNTMFCFIGYTIITLWPSVISAVKYMPDAKFFSHVAAGITCITLLFPLTCPLHKGRLSELRQLRMAFNLPFLVQGHPEASWEASRATLFLGASSWSAGCGGPGSTPSGTPPAVTSALAPPAWPAERPSAAWRSWRAPSCSSSLWSVGGLVCIKG